MRAVLQRVTRARVTVAASAEDDVVGNAATPRRVVGQITRPGLVALIGVAQDDGPAQVARMARKIAELRILRDEHSVLTAGAPVLVVSQFTLYGDCRKGRRPSWSAAAPSPVAEPLITAVVTRLREQGIEVATGEFGADMAVELVNDGPVTLIVDA